MSQFLACKKTFDAINVTELTYSLKRSYVYMECPKILRPTGMSSLSCFWRNLWQRLNAELKISSTYHQQSDGQMEVVNKTLGNMIHFLAGNQPK